VNLLKLSICSQSALSYALIELCLIPTVLCVTYALVRYVNFLSVAALQCSDANCTATGPGEHSVL